MTPAESSTPSAPQSAPPQQQPAISHGKPEMALLRCGPLLRYCGTDYPREGTGGDGSTSPLWRGSILLVVSAQGEAPAPSLPPSVLYTGEIVGGTRSPGDERIGEGGVYTDEDGVARRLIKAKVKLILEEEGNSFYRYMVEVGLEERERRVTYVVGGVRREVRREEEEEEAAMRGERQEEKEKGADTSNTSPPTTSTSTLTTSFHVPSSTSPMRLIFHSCNGFSVGTDISAFSGPVLWRDILRTHNRPGTSYHLLLGGGDQIYSDGIRVSGPLAHWANLPSPRRRRAHPYPPDLATQVNSWYRENYISWYTTPPLSTAASRIPSINMWDDHDIIDGWGSYTDKFMRCPVFHGVGAAAWRYYMIFQQHTPPEGEASEDSSWVISPEKGPYIPQQGRSIYARLGYTTALLALDARTERTRHQICPASTYDIVFTRLEQELSRGAVGGVGTQPVKHLLILLGVPIAYPRLVWLETILRSPLLGFLKFLNQRFGIANGAFNHFDGEVDILDDLDDHWAARVHKKERAGLVTRWQALSKKYSVRISVLSGDVHLAALGRFYTRPSRELRVNIQEERREAELSRFKGDWRYSPNIISSAITNKPPPKAVARLVARKNKVHRLGKETEELMVGLFGQEGEGEGTLMPRRNYCVIRGVEGGEEGGVGAGEGASGREGGLWVEFRVEKEQGGRDGETSGWGFVVPKLVLEDGQVEAN